MVVDSENVNMSSPNSAEVSGSPSPAPSSIGNNAPKYGTLVPNRVFVGGISASTTEQDLLELFSQYGMVKATKIISDRAGVSKGYGFVTFETEEEARRLTQEGDNIMLKDRKLNIAPAIKKQVSDVGYIKNYSPRLIDTSSSVLGSSGTVFFSNGAGYTTVPVMAPTEYHPTFPQATAAAAPTSASAYQTLVYPQPMYYPQQYQYQPAQTMQPQWGAAAPQWRWITPASYPQQPADLDFIPPSMLHGLMPECSPQHCLAEHNSPSPGDLTTASATESPPLISTSLTLGCFSTPTMATATSTICATVKTFSTTVTKTTATPTVSVKVGRSQDPVLQMKPQLQPAKPIPFNGRPKVNLTVNTKTSFGEDKDYISSEGSKVGGGSNGIPSISLLMPQPVSSSHGCITSSSSSNKTATTTITGSSSTTITGSSSTTTTATPTTISKNINGSGNPKVSENNGSGRKVIEEVGAGISEEDQGCNRMMHHAPERNGDPSESVNQPSHIGEYNANYNRAGLGNVQNNILMSWGGWIPVTYGKEDAWRQYGAHPSVHPHQHSGRTPYQYGSPRHLQTPHMTTPQSWTHIGYPLGLPHDQSHSLRNTSPTFNHNMNQALLLPHPAYSPNKNSTYNGTQLHTVNQPQPLAQNDHTMETSCKTSYSRPTTAQTNGNLCPPATLSNSSSNNDAGNSTTTLSSKTNSPLSTPSSVVNRKACPPSLAGNGIEQTAYGYVNQKHMIMMPYYQYSGSVAPYCSWAAPVVMQWPMAQSPSFHSTPNNSVGMAAQPKGLENCLPHTALTFTPQNEKHITSTSPQAMTPKFKEVLSPATNSIPFSKPGRGGHMSYSRNRSFKGQALHSPTYNFSPEMLCEQPEQKMEHLKGSVSSFPHMFSSTARRAAMSPSKFPRPLAPSQSQTGPPGKGFSSNSGVISTVKALAGQEEHCTTVPMTPPPTPLPNIDEISDAVENISAS